MDDPNDIAFLPNAMKLNGTIRQRHTDHTEREAHNCPCTSQKAGMISTEVTDAKCVMHYTDTIKETIHRGSKTPNDDKTNLDVKSDRQQRRSSILDSRRASVIETQMGRDPSLTILNEYMAAKSRLKCENPYHVPQRDKPLLFPTEKAREEHGKYLGEVAYKCQVCETVTDKKQEIGVHFAKYHPRSKMRYCQYCDGYYADHKSRQHTSIHNIKHTEGQKTVRRYSTHATKTPNRATAARYGLDYARKHSKTYQDKHKLTKVCGTCGYAMLANEKDHTSHLYCYKHHHTIPKPISSCNHIVPKTEELVQCPVCLTVDTHTHQTHQFCRNGELLPPKRSLGTPTTCSMSRDVDIDEGLEYCDTCKFPFHKSKPHIQHVQCDKTNVFPLHHELTVGKNCVVVGSEDEEFI